MKGEIGAKEISSSEWIHVADIKDISLLERWYSTYKLGKGELSAILLAKEFNADVIRKIFKNEPHPARHVIVANAGALIWIAERAAGKKPFTLKEAVKKAEDSLSSGAALSRCEDLARISHTIEV